MESAEASGTSCVEFVVHDEFDTACSPPSGPVLVLCSHGTRSPSGRATVGTLCAALRARRPGLDVRLAFVDVHRPFVADKVAALIASGRSVVVVPVLLSSGYHVQVDVGRAVRPFDQATSTGPLGPHPLLADVLADRLREAGGGPGDAVVLAAAGSSRPATLDDVAAMAGLLQQRWPGPVSVGYGTIARPSVADAVAAARAVGAARVLVASYLLAPGHFHNSLSSAGADAVSGPLGTDPRVLDVILQRYDASW